ncbi:hypothetical protein H9W90_11490 [Polaribacter pectinis]|uniref:Outer membrane protein beta-barrel domain-containing protein n=1 Tax=Polaribacter pectinis TaxID=2738844 RepID=A0A7G9L864_9FLAO|nr:hypothetical protein [Polaribacter pectinis]QNM84813.1 hypothetical protein H9W90_11490 [Polaribacter pectinis]
MENKNIDRLFQEQLKNLEATPDKKVWNNIESKLAKKKRRVIPFWWFSSGVAALLILGLFLFPFSNKDNSIENNNIIITETPKNKTEIDKSITNTIDTLLLNKKDVLVAEENVDIKPKKKIKIKSDDSLKVVKNNTNKTEDKKELVSTKNAMKKIFLADNSTNETINSKENKSETLNKESKEELNFIQKSDEFLTEKNETDKTDFNEFINKKDSINIKQLIKKQWTVAPVFAVLNSNSFSNTSPIDENLANSTEGKNTYSYGVQVAYKINNKWTIQSGVHLQEMSYANNKIAVVSSNPSSTSSAAFNNGESFSFKGNTAESFDFATSSLTNTVSSNGSLTQNYGYIEIPVEIKYNFSNNKKLETQLVAGFSSLFLNKNNINLNTNSFSKTGKANNLNSINFSGNLGFDVNYLFNENWSLNVNPMFKAQLNTFSNNSNGFSPFNIGVYTGIKYTF